MAPKDKAKELVDRYMNYCDGSISQEEIDAYDNKYNNGKKLSKRFSDLSKFALLFHAKKSALICVGEIIEEIEPDELYQRYNERVTYWRDVKQEIERL